MFFDPIVIFTYLLRQVDLSIEPDGPNDLTDGSVELTAVKTEENANAEEAIELPKETPVEEQVPLPQMPQLQEANELVSPVPVKDEIIL